MKALMSTELAVWSGIGFLAWFLGKPLSVQITCLMPIAGLGVKFQQLFFLLLTLKTIAVTPCGWWELHPENILIIPPPFSLLMGDCE